MYIIESGEGTMRCHDNGTPFRLDRLPHEYRDIVKFDIARLEAMCEANDIDKRQERMGWDILAVGYWLEDGSYEEPAPSYAENGIMMHLWTGRAQDHDEALALGGDT
jgi:hypothetical protein